MSFSQTAAIFLTALALATGGTYLAREIALRTGSVDHPGRGKQHARPTPLLGGVAIYIAFIATLLLVGDRLHIDQAIVLLVGASLASLLGLWDDRRPISPAAKLLGQTVAAVVVVLAGVRIRLTGFEVVDFMLALAWILYVTNAFNLLDNMDGLAAGVGAIASAAFLALAAMNGQYLVGALAAALLGACTGFLFFNFNPARIFMGDAGSLFIGFVMAGLAIKIRLPSQSMTVSWMVPIIVLGIPIFDTAFVTLSRLIRGRPFWLGGADHVSHRLLSLGYGPRRVALILYAAGGACAILATMVAVLPPRFGFSIGVGLLAVFGLAFVALQRITPTAAGENTWSLRESKEDAASVG